MKRSGIIKLVTAILLLASCTLAMAENRSTYKRLLSSMYNEFHSVGGGTTCNQYICYTDSQSILMSSMEIQKHSDYYGDTERIYQISGNITEMDTRKQVDYIGTIEGQTIPAFNYTFVLDLQGRVVQSRYSEPSQSYLVTREYYRRYNSVGYADSVYYKSVVGTSTYENYFVRHFNGNSLSECITYYKSNGNWIPEARIRFTYSAVPIILQSFIRWDTWINQTFLRFYYMDNDEAYYNPKVIPQTIIRDNWENNHWVQASGYSYDQRIIGTQIQMATSISTDFTSYSRSDLFATEDGDIVRLNQESSSGEEGGSSTAVFNWDSIGEIDDEEVIAIDHLPCAYPNPFKESTKIRLENSSKLGSKVSIYNLRGQLVRQWENVLGNEVFWDGKDEQMQPVPKGVYLLKYEEGQKVRYGKLMRY